MVPNLWIIGLSKKNEARMDSEKLTDELAKNEKISSEYEDWFGPLKAASTLGTRCAQAWRVFMFFKHDKELEKYSFITSYFDRSLDRLGSNGLDNVD